MPDNTLPHAVTITVSPQLLEGLLRLPPDVRITGATHNSLTQTIILRLDSPNFPTVRESEIPAPAALTYDPETKTSTISQ